MINELAPDHVGIVLDEGFDAWDSVNSTIARSLIAHLTDVVLVAISLATDRGQILRTVDQLSPGVLHVARAVGGMTIEELLTLRGEIAPVQLMVTVPVVGSDSVAAASEVSDIADFLLLDTVHPTTGYVGATGQVHDWSLSRRIVDASNIPVILAGGLGPENVSEAIRVVRPFGVDSETQTSMADDRRRKDPDKVRLFIERARSVEVSETD